MQKVQSGGEPVKKSGFIKKRGNRVIKCSVLMMTHLLGGAKGGSTAFKRRWFVLTQYGRVLYFRTPRSFQALGQFTVLKVSTFSCSLTVLHFIILVLACRMC